MDKLIDGMRISKKIYGNESEVVSEVTGDVCDEIIKSMIPIMKCVVKREGNNVNCDKIAINTDISDANN